MAGFRFTLALMMVALMVFSVSAYHKKNRGHEGESSEEHRGHGGGQFHVQGGEQHRNPSGGQFQVHGGEEHHGGSGGQFDVHGTQKHHGSKDYGHDGYKTRGY